MYGSDVGFRVGHGCGTSGTSDKERSVEGEGSAGASLGEEGIYEGDRARKSHGR